ncbi:MAG TPA: hypothetical protein VNX28_05750 [Gemmataceae bacterium]|jgi:hypothetical protein|nr:hypothetical protein [Gemmataceae bacterium]
MGANTATLEQLDPSAFHFYRRAFEILKDAEIPFLLGGAYAFGHYTGIARHTKDLDLFVRPAHVQHTLQVLAAAGYRAELLFSHWLGKAFHGNDFVDIIFSSGNGLCRVDDAWFANAVGGNVLGANVRLTPVEEMIWQKAYIMERERFDGADVIHLLHARGRQLDWDRLLFRFGAHGRVLLSHLILYGFVYPDDRDSIPARVLSELIARLDRDPSGEARTCMGTVLSRTQYLADIEEWGYADPRLTPLGALTREQLMRWTDAGR